MIVSKENRKENHHFGMRGGVPKKDTPTCNPRPGHKLKANRASAREIDTDFTWLWLKEVVPKWHLGKWNQRLKPA